MIIKGYCNLNNKTLNDVFKLEKICNKYDNLLGSMFLDPSLNFDRQIKTVFLLYEHRQLISMLSMFIPTRLEAEITGYTLPRNRCKGYFKALFLNAIEELGKFHIPKILFVCESQSISGKQAIKALKIEYAHTEYSMRLDLNENIGPCPSSSAEGRLTLMRTKPGDSARTIATSMKTFEEPYEEAKSWIESCLKLEGREQYLALLDEEEIGLVSTNNELGSIFGFGIVPKYRGKGYGKELLRLIVNRLRQKGKTEITLDVNSENKPALELYKKFGFEIEAAYDYYHQSLQADQI